MAAMKAIDNVYYVGVQDKDLRVFDIIMRTDYGTSYNAYIVTGREKTALIETVEEPFFDEFVQNIREVIDPQKIDYIVVNHTEPDHTGAYARLLELCPNATVLLSTIALTYLKEIVNTPFSARAVTEKDRIDLGGLTLSFLSVPMLHWPDTMYTWVQEIGALFTCDSFGCHYADDRVFNDQIDGDFTVAYKYYFDCIMGPFKNPHMLKALDKIKALPVRFIGNGHGPVLRSNLDHYIGLYRAWATPVARECPTAAIAYVSAYGYTRQLAQAIERGLHSGGIEDVRMFDLVVDDMEEAAAAASEADGLLLGSPTLLGDALPPVWALLNRLNPIVHRGKYAGAFGSYGWSGEATGFLTARMEQLKLKLPVPALRVRFRPTQEQLGEACAYGRTFAQAILEGESK